MDMRQLPEIFISYAWQDNVFPSWSPIVKHLHSVLTESKKYNIKIDVESIGYKDNIKNYMKDLGKGNYIIAEISEKYLKSKNCMFEAVEMLKYPNFNDRIFPIITDDANIYDADKVIEYIKYWDNRIYELNNAVKSLDNIAYANSILEELELYSEIRRVIAQFGGKLSEMNVLTLDKHKNNDFSDLIKSIDAKIEVDRQEYELRIEIGSLKVENDKLKQELNEINLKYADIVLKNENLQNKIKDLQNENEILNQKITVNNPPALISSDQSSSQIKEYKSFMDFSNQDTVDKIFRIFGNPTQIHKDEDKFEFNTIYYEEKVSFSYFRANNQIMTISVMSRANNPTPTIKFLTSKGITDHKINLLGKHRDEILKLYGSPHLTNSDNYQYWFSDLTVNFICYEHDGYLCSSINIQYFK